jgi:hypothetical protein
MMKARASKHCFFVKKQQKTFFNGGTGVVTGTGPDKQSFFCFFFVHKKDDLTSPSNSTSP